MRQPDIENITVFTDASFCHQTHAAGGAFWAKGFDLKMSDSFAFSEAVASHDAEVITACQAILRLAAHQELGKMLALGPKTRIVLVIDCLTVKQVFEGRMPASLCEAARTLVKQVLALRNRHKFWLKVNHVKAHSGSSTPRQWVNNWCDRQSREQMLVLRGSTAQVAT